MADLSLLLEDATAEAKKRGHGSVTPAHLAIVLSSRYPDREEWTDTIAVAERNLQALPVTYDAPVLEAVLDSYQSALKSGDVDALITLVKQALQPSGEGADLSGPVENSIDVPSVHVGWVTKVLPDDGVMGRESVVAGILDALDRRERTSVLLVGPEGCGRTAMAAALASAVEDRGLTVIRLDSAATPPDKRMAALTEMLRLARDQGILFIDDLEIALGLGYPTGADSGFLMQLRPAIEASGTRIVAVLANAYLDRMNGTDRELVEELARVDLPVLPADILRKVVSERAGGIATFHGVQIPDSLLESSLVEAESGEIGTHPALAIRRLDIAAARRARQEPGGVVAIEDLPMPIRLPRGVDRERLAAALRAKVVGQDKAIDAVVARLSITVAEFDLNPHRPDGVFLFAGPTGVGKTALALAIAGELFGSLESVVRLDMSELHDRHTVAKLVGSPPGYVGHDSPEGWLTTQIRRNPRCLLLLDEVEKAHPLVWNTFLQVFDAGRLTDLRGETADFREVVIVMTTNLGSDVFDDQGSLGFVNSDTSVDSDITAVSQVLRRTMPPELLNRLDEILVFSPLTPEVIRDIAEQRMREARERVLARGYDITISAELIALIQRCGFSKQYGARELLRTIERMVLAPLAGLPAGSYKPVIEGDVLSWQASPPNP